MKKTSIVSIGNEILSGQTINTNAAHLSRKLFSIGIPVVSVYTVGDDIDSIVRALKLAGEDADFILVTGGLGPTDDDLTRQGFAQAFGTKLELQDGLLAEIEVFFADRNKKMPEKNKIQAYIPLGAQAVTNKLGTAPGFMVERESKLFFALPGVPMEMEQMFEESVLPKLKEQASEQAISVKRLKCFGASESEISEILGPLMQRGRNPLINCTVYYGIKTLEIVATTKEKDTAEQMVAKDEKLLREKLGELIYGTDEQTLAEVVGHKLAELGKTIAVAESCTGGLLARMITDVPGASRYFTHGWITYSDDAKTSELGVSEDTINKYGAVSEQVAAALAEGARKKSGADFAISITGIAGPTGASEQKPVGLVYISLADEKVCNTGRYIFSGNRNAIRMHAAHTALNILRLQLND